MAHSPTDRVAENYDEARRNCRLAYTKDTRDARGSPTRVEVHAGVNESGTRPDYTTESLAGRSLTTRATHVARGCRRQASGEAVVVIEETQWPATHVGLRDEQVAQWLPAAVTRS